MFVVADNGKIYTEYELKDYITSLGFDTDDVKAVLAKEEIAYLNQLEDELNDDEYELLYDGMICGINSFKEEIDKVILKLESGKGLTKAQAAEKIKYFMDCYL